jgi:hypothetical protein
MGATEIAKALKIGRASWVLEGWWRAAAEAASISAGFTRDPIDACARIHPSFHFRLAPGPGSRSFARPMTTQKAKPYMNMPTFEETRIKALLEAWVDAVRRHDVPAILAHHESDVVMFDLPPPLQCKGIDVRTDLGPALPIS